MFILGDYSKEEWKCCEKENNLNYFVKKNTTVVENRIQGTC